MVAFISEFAVFPHKTVEKNRELWYLYCIITCIRGYNALLIVYCDIEIKAAQKHSIILISCKNPVPGNAKNRKLDPQKSSGYGLKILRDIAMQYNGSFDIEIADGICTAVIAIVTDISDTKGK